MGRFPTLRTRKIAFPGRIKSHFARLTPGDKFLVLVFGALFSIAALTGLYALERVFLVEVPSQGGSLTEGIVGAPRFVHPLLALSDSDRDLVTLTYAGLMGYGADGTLTPVLAESYEIAPDGKSYTFRLREHAKFADGSPVTAEDVVFTVQKAQDPGLKSPKLADWANIRVEAVDARTVRFTLPKAYAPFLTTATMGILPAHVWRNIENEEFPFSRFTTEPIGAGPFEVSRVVRDKDGFIERYELTAFSDYALGKPYLTGFRFVIYETEEELEEALARGSVESGYGVVSEHPLRTPYSRVFGAFFNPSQNPLFARPEVREALSVATNRDRLVAEVLGGYASPITGPVPPGSAPLIPESSADPIGEAASILEEAGWKYDTEARVWKNEKAGLELSVKLTTSNVPELKAVAEYLRNDWQNLGVPVSLELHEPGELVANSIRPRKYDVLLFGMVIGRDQDLFAFWDSSERNDPGLNVALYANRLVDELLEKLRVETDPLVRAEDLEKLNALISADHPAVFLYAPDFLYEIPHDIQGISLDEITVPSDRLANARFWYRHTEWVWPIFVRGN